MTKKDYELIASIFRAEIDWHGKQGYKPEHTSVYHVILKFVTALEKDNPKFDRHKFLTACGIGQPVYVNNKGETVTAND